ncbi:hypothetical protein A3850_013510 [Lewinella sp. 4G2]|nr:hypothetical protein A3850_013510 [Lewinella sp. 4G2]
MYEYQQATNGNGWSYADTLNFGFSIDDPHQPYDLEIIVDHTEQYAYENLYLNIYTTPPTGIRTKERISIDLAGDFGAWNGDCSGGECEYSIPILLDTRFPNVGTYQITLEQNSRDEPLPAITGLGLRLVESPEQ